MLTQQSKLRRANFFPEARRLTDALSAAGEPLLFGIRLWASVCLALYVAFWLQLDHPFWAGTSAAIVCQPRSVVCVALIKFAVLPGLETFPALSLALGLYLIPIGFALAQSRKPATVAVFTGMT